MAQPNAYAVGARVRLSVTFTNSAGTAADPTTVTVKYRNGPSGAVTTKVYVTDSEVVRTGTGAYYIDVSVSAEGVWYYRWTATGTVVAADEDVFTADETQFD